MNKQNVTKKEHYIPQFYLKNFYADDKKLAVYYFENDTIRSKTAKQICWEDSLYEAKCTTENMEKFILCENLIEKVFSKRESEFKKTVNKIIEICKEKQNINKLICTKEEKKVMAAFIANLFLRNPITLQCRLDEYKANKNIDNSDEFLELFFPSLIDATTKLAYNIAWLADARKDGIFDRTVKALENLHMFFCMSCERNFVFSDFPVMFQTNKTGDFTYVHVPLSPDYLIVYTNNKYARAVRNKLILLDNKTVDKINYMYITQKYDRKLLIAKNSDDIKHVLKCKSEDMSFL